MKILLTAINAKYIHSNLAVYSLRAYARAYQDQVELKEFTINQKKEQILKGIYQSKPDVLCISCYIWNISLVLEVVQEIFKILPETRIWLGGPEVSYHAKELLEQYPQLAGIMKGEGEQTFLELVHHYVDGDVALRQIAGITYRENEQGLGQEMLPIGSNFAGYEMSEKIGTIVENPWRPVLDLSTVPFVYENIKDFENRIIYYESSRGCPFSCSYCLSSVDRKLRFRSLDLVKKELQFFLDNKVPQVKFVDRTFNCKHEHAMEIWKYLIVHDNGITNFHFEVAADLLTDEEISLINTMRPGMIQLEIGVQSTNDKTIGEIRRKMNFAIVSDRVQKVMAGKNVHQHLDLIAGLPFEGYESFRQSFNQVYGLKPQQLQLGFLKVLRGSYMHEMAQEYGCVYQDKEPYEVLFTKWLSYDDVLRLKLVEEMTEVYYNSSQFCKTLPAMERLFETPFDLYEALGLFYEEKGYLDISHNRIHRYEILLEFLAQRDAGHLPLYKELMMFDLYSRENLKNRPVWAFDEKIYKNAFREFYLAEAQEHFLLKGYEAYDEKQLAKMTHLEVMHYHPDTYEAGEYAFLFDYQRRDVLTYAATVQEVKLNLGEVRK